ncbi:hypothetical protein PG984_007132 [Apiospora sp. TS-2023a]
MGLQQLPHVLLAKIADGLTSQRDLASFSLVSTSFHAAALPALYRSVTLTVDEKDLQGYNAKEIGTAREKGYLGHARSLTLRAALRDNLEHRDRCFHAALRFNKNRAEAFEDRLAGNLLPVIEACRDGSLLDFRLFTDPRCDEMRHGVTFDGLDLQAFSKLKRLSWTGIPGDDAGCLGGVLEAVGHLLEMLDLDFTCYRSPPERMVVDGPLDEDVLFEDYVNMGVYRSLLSRVFQLHQPVPLSLPALRDLRLCHVDVGLTPTDVEGLLGSVDFARLERLELRSCGNSELILARLTASSVSSPGLLLANLRSFALQVPDNIGVVFVTGVLPFLQSFEGLRDLFLDMPTNKDTTAEIWRAAAAHHQRTLRRFVYHQRKYDAEAGTEPGSWLRWDQPDLCLMSSDLGTGPEGNPLCSLDLESLGLGCSPKWMKRIIAPFCQKSSLKLLHMRRSGYEFARMARIWKDARPDNNGPPPQRRQRNPLDPGGSGSDGEFDEDQSDEYVDSEEEHNGGPSSSSFVPGRAMDPIPMLPAGIRMGRPSPLGQSPSPWDIDLARPDDEEQSGDGRFGAGSVADYYEGGFIPGPHNDPVLWDYICSVPESEMYDRPGKLGQIRADYVRFEKDLHKFLQWVFGPRGVRSLCLFLYGDFSFNGRFKDDCRIICRNETTDEEVGEQDAETGREPEHRVYYRDVTKEDRDLLNLLEEEDDFVTACRPADNMFGS